MTRLARGLALVLALSVAPATAAGAASPTLLKDGQTVLLDLTSGPGSRVQGSRGAGKFRQTFRAAQGTFGPARVLDHSETELRFKNRDDCILKADRTVTCKSGSRGTWR